jgi:hypothetical protein
LSAAAGLLQGFHAVIAMKRGPHWLLNDADAKAYGTALANALRHLPVTMAQKWIDYSALGLAVFAYEGPRVAIDMQLRQQRDQPRPRPQGPAQVFQFRTAPADAPRPAPPPSQEGEMTYEPELEPAL